MVMQTDKVRFNVGGKIFETTAITLANAGRNSMFGAMFDDQWNLRPREVNDEYFIDRDPKCFSVLNLLRTGKLHVPPNVPEKLLCDEALYYGLLDNVRSAKWGRFDCNHLEVTSSVRCHAPRDCTAIRAGPGGGCAVTDGSMVHVYNWMLEKHAPLNLDYRFVKDIGWIDLENILISAGQRVRDGDGAMVLYSPSTGDLTHRYEVKSRVVGALCFNSDKKIFSSCTGGIGVWDQVTGKEIDFFSAPSDWPYGYADKIEWLNGNSCLLASVIGRSSDLRHISLLDFRDKNMVWSWNNRDYRIGETWHYDEENRFYDVIAMEEVILFALLVACTHPLP